MIYFYVLEDNLLHRKKITKIIKTICLKKKIEYAIKYNLEKRNLNNGIFILDFKNNHLIKNIDDKHLKKYIFLLPKNEHKKILYTKKNLFIVNKDTNFEEVIKNRILEIIDNNFNDEQDSRIYICYKNVKLLLNKKDIMYIERNKSTITINSMNKDNAYYSIKIKKKYINFENINNEELIMSRKDYIFNLPFENLSNTETINLSYPKKKKRYSKEIKETVILEYRNKKNVKTLSTKYNISKSTIYRWVKEYKIMEKLNKLLVIETKYQKIVEIVDEKGSGTECHR